MAIFPTGLQLSNLLYKVKPRDEMQINKARITIPALVMLGKVPFINNPGITNNAPPMAKLYPVPTNTSTRFPSPRVINPAKAEQRAFRIIMPSPNQVNCPLSSPLRFSVNIPMNPMAQPMIFRVVSLSDLKNKHAKSTNINTKIWNKIE